MISVLLLANNTLFVFKYHVNFVAKSLVSLCSSPRYLLSAAQVYEELEAGGAFDDGNIARNNLFLSVHDAILFAQQTTGERRVSPEVEPHCTK